MLACDDWSRNERFDGWRFRDARGMVYNKTMSENRALVADTGRQAALMVDVIKRVDGRLARRKWETNVSDERRERHNQPGQLSQGSGRTMCGCWIVAATGLTRSVAAMLDGEGLMRGAERHDTSNRERGSRRRPPPDSTGTQTRRETNGPDGPERTFLVLGQGGRPLSWPTGPPGRQGGAEEDPWAMRR